MLMRLLRILDDNRERAPCLGHLPEIGPTGCVASTKTIALLSELPSSLQVAGSSKDRDVVFNRSTSNSQLVRWEIRVWIPNRHSTQDR